MFPVKVEFDLRPITCPKKNTFTPGECQA